ncbi:MAG TPA: hypothetical protein VF469_37905 [Kofleriaceae bacterium]
MARDDEIAAIDPSGEDPRPAGKAVGGPTPRDPASLIAEAGRRTRQATPRWLWSTAAVIGVICATGFGVTMLGSAEPSVHPVGRRLESDPGSGTGFGTGLVLGAGGGVAIGFALARQRRDHSSRRRP